MNLKNLLDSKIILENLFHPRRAPLQQTGGDDYHDGRIRVDDEVGLGYRLYPNQSDSPLLLYFHGNGEIASDYDALAPFYKGCGVSLIVVDYRGYGWSDGSPLTSRLLPDAEQVLLKLPFVLSKHNLSEDVPVFVKGRSLGSAPAIYIAYKQPQKLRGLIVESGYADAPSLFRRIGIPIPRALTTDPELPLNNTRKIAEITLPTLIIHGENDTLLPVSHGQKLYYTSPSDDKTLVIIPNAGHNDVQIRDMERYFLSVRDFITTTMI